MVKPSNEQENLTLPRFTILTLMVHQFLAVLRTLKEKFMSYIKIIVTITYYISFYSKLNYL